MKWESLAMMVIYNVVVPFAIVHSTLGSPWDYVVGVAALIVTVRVWFKGNELIDKLKKSAVYRMLVGG